MIILVQHNELLLGLNQNENNQTKFQFLENNLQFQQDDKKLGVPQYNQISKIKTKLFANQVRALFRKNISLQRKQIGTNCCQVKFSLLLFKYYRY